MKSSLPVGPDGRGIRRISVVTPCRNSRHRLPATLESVLAQTAVASGRVELEYFVCDGASGDGTAEIARELCGDRATVVSEPDGGMYDALARGLRRATGDVVAYINAGDLFSRSAFDVVADVFESHPARWITGYSVILNERHQVVSCRLPYGYRRSALRRGIHGRWLPYVQQESTFWSRSLHETIDWEVLSRMRLAGDAYLWSRFATQEDLWVVQAYLGGFTIHAGQLSSDKESYWDEAAGVVEPARPADRILAAMDRLAWKTGVKRTRDRRLLLRYDHEAKRWA